MPRKYTRRPLSERFWEKVDKRGPIPVHRPELGPCWLWTDRPSAWGYGRLTFGGTVILAHRLSWEIHNGRIPDGLSVLHHCDNRPCCNPSHLFLGTRADNMKDMFSKGRYARYRPNQRGERHPHAKLTWDQVRTIRARRAEGESMGVLAREYGVSDVTISNVVKHKVWRE